MSKTPGGIMAVFEHVDVAADSIRALKEMGHKDMTVYTPAPLHEIEDAIGHTSSPVRVWTLVGGLSGCSLGYAMTMWMSYDYPVVVGGKALGSLPPYIIIMFELTILLGALSTVAGLIFHAIKNSRSAGYDPRCSDDLIGIFVPCPVERRSAVENLLKEKGATEVKVEV
jgi:hypothetical protein